MNIIFARALLRTRLIFNLSDFNDLFINCAETTVNE